MVTKKFGQYMENMHMVPTIYLSVDKNVSLHGKSTPLLLIKEQPNKW